VNFTADQSALFKRSKPAPLQANNQGCTKRKEKQGNQDRPTKNNA